MKERPILMKGAMVRATLEDRKTQTRRIIKPQPIEWAADSSGSWPIRWDGNPTHQPTRIKCPYGVQGDRLWVKETFRLSTLDDCACYDPCDCRSGVPIYRADYLDNDVRWKPSIFMPRWASRITLEIEAVMVERLQDISEQDARAEGCDGDCPVGHIPSHQESPCVYHYAQLWESINGPGSWDANPWVWVIQFRRIQ